MTAPIHDNTNPKQSSLEYSSWNPFLPTERDIKRTEELALKNLKYFALLTFFVPFGGMLYLNRGINTVKMMGYTFILLFFFFLSMGTENIRNSQKESLGIINLIRVSASLGMIVENVRSVTLARKRLASQKQMEE